MAHLTLAGLSDDGRRLLLVSARGVEFTLDVDDRLKAALSGDHARLGQLEITMTSVLRPRDIQARIRAGETPEAVAQAAQTTVEAIMPFAAPVIAERQHVADRAQRASVRRTGAPGGGARTLGDAVAAHLRSAGTNPDTVDWDSARREDGKWTLTAAYTAGARSGIARFVFDAPGNYAVADNDHATWLVGDAPQDEAAAPVSDDIARARARRAAASEPAGDEALPLGDDAISMVSADQPVEAYLDDVPTQHSDEPAADEPTAEEAEEKAARQDEPPAAKPARKRGRASVPSWDEIMFGGGKSE